MPRIVPEPRAGEEILAEIDRHEGAYWLAGASAASVPFVHNVAGMLDLRGFFWAVLVPAWIMSISFALAKRKTYYLTNQRLVVVTPFTEKSLKLEDMDVVALRDHVPGVPQIEAPFGATLIFRKKGRRFIGRIRVGNVKRPEAVVEAVDAAVMARHMQLYEELLPPRRLR